MVLVIRRPLIATLKKLMENKNGDEDPHESHKPKYKYFANWRQEREDANPHSQKDPIGLGGGSHDVIAFFCCLYIAKKIC